MPGKRSPHSENPETIIGGSAEHQVSGHTDSSSRKRRLLSTEDTTVSTKRLKLQASGSKQEVDTPTLRKRNRPRIKVVKDVCAAVTKCLQGVEMLETLLPNLDSLGNTATKAHRDSQRKSTTQADEIWGAAEDEVLRALTPNYLEDGRRLQERFGFEILVEKIQEMLSEYELV
ncbi:hypothetical protein CPB85DRAFT_1538509 [Mucidula mucida]|nr:hypothetical protein CPB85DRAFT_1538509 [Mucidula mucida]